VCVCVRFRERKNKLPEQGGTHNKLPKSKALKVPFFISELIKSIMYRSMGVTMVEMAEVSLSRSVSLYLADGLCLCLGF
jgi:hypothetical protein